MRGTPDDGGPLPWVATATAVAVAVILAVLLLPAGLPAVADGDLGAGWRWTLSALLVALHLTLLPPLVTRWPVVAFTTGSVCMLGLVVAPDLAGDFAAQSGGAVAPVLLPSGLVWFVLLYAVSSRTEAPWPSVGLAVGLVGSVLVLVRLWESDAAPVVRGSTGWRMLLAAALLGGTLAAWALGRYRATQRAWTEARTERAAADERRRIAREMHDVVAHSLAVVVAQAEGGRMLVSTQPARAPEILADIAAQGREALGQMRGLLGVLRQDDGGTSAGEPGGLEVGAEEVAEPPQPTLADLPALVARVRGTGRLVELETYGDPRRVDTVTALTAYRVVQESLTNIVKHAGDEATAHVSVDWTDGLTLTVSDDGTAGARAAGTSSSGSGPGRGLVGMRERVESVGGTLTAGPRPEGGWSTCARIPV